MLRSIRCQMFKRFVTLKFETLRRETERFFKESFSAYFLTPLLKGR